MIYSICLRTPAGETKSVEVDDNDAPNYAIHTPLRIGLGHLMRWIDEHVEWTTDGPKLLRPFHGDGDWIIRAHTNDKVCEICGPEWNERVSKR